MYRQSEIFFDDIRQNMIDWRRDIHANPETAFEETSTRMRGSARWPAHINGGHLE